MDLVFFSPFMISQSGCNSEQFRVHLSSAPTIWAFRVLRFLMRFYLDVQLIKNDLQSLFIAWGSWAPSRIHTCSPTFCTPMGLLLLSKDTSNSSALAFYSLIGKTNASALGIMLWYMAKIFSQYVFCNQCRVGQQVSRSGKPFYSFNMLCNEFKAWNVKSPSINFCQEVSSWVLP